jgi:hypothetical protein
MPLRVTIEVIPYGVESDKKTLAVLEIGNDGTGNALKGHYKYELRGVTIDDGFDLLENGTGTVHDVVRQDYLHVASVVLNSALEKCKWMSLANFIDNVNGGEGMSETRYIVSVPSMIQDGPDHWSSVLHTKSIGCGETIGEIYEWARTIEKDPTVTITPDESTRNPNDKP